MDVAPSAPLDCLVVGGGPAGLTAAIYLARFHLSVLLVDGGQSRTGMIPVSHNHPGFPDGVVGSQLLDRMRDQATRYGARHVASELVDLTIRDDLLDGATAQGQVRARTVLLATGVRNRQPDMPQDLHDTALARGLLRYCPICDGFEVTDRSVAVIGTSEMGVDEAEFLRSYTADVTLIAPDGAHAFDAAHRSRIAAAGIRALDGPCLDFALTANRIVVALPDARHGFHSIYPAFGVDVRSHLAVGLGARVSSDGCLVVDAEQRTTVPGIYAAGDVAVGLDQISNAIGQGGVAATAIRNDLAARRPLRR